MKVIGNISGFLDLVAYMKLNVNFFFLFADTLPVNKVFVTFISRHIKYIHIRSGYLNYNTIYIYLHMLVLLQSQVVEVF